MKIEIKHRWSDNVLYSGEHDSLRQAVEKAIESGANLRGADLTGADLSEADLSGVYLRGANLGAIRDDFRDVLDAAPNEVAGLRLAVAEGRIDGSMYEGECACLVGTIANIKHCDYGEIAELTPDSWRPAERFFLAISEGDTPETSQPAAIVLGWIDEWIADRAAVGEALR